MQPMDFVGAAKRLDDIDIPRIGAIIGVGEDEVHAVMDVEAGKSGFDTHDRPKMLFEPHVFYRHLKGAERDRAIAEGLAYPDWRRNYPADSYPRLCRAIAINQTAALMSASWGRGQILGQNYALAGFESPEEMVEAFTQDEEEHLEAMIRFIKNAGLDDELRAHDWAGFARGYNGPGYAKNAYNVKLASAYRKWAGIPDTPWGGPEEEGDRPVFEKVETVRGDKYPVIRMGDKGFLVEHLQKMLSEKGYLVGDVDGAFGKLTRGAVLTFQADSGLETDAVVGDVTWAALEAADSRQVSDARAGATEKDLREKGSSTIKATDGGKIGAAITGLIGMLGAVNELIGEAEGGAGEIMGAFDDVKGLVSDNWPVVAVLAAVLGWRQFQKISKARVKDHQSAANTGR